MQDGEHLIQYIWGNRLFDLPLISTDGDEIELVDTGQQNPDSGPDFFNARIRIRGILWAGNVEVHVRSSDWERHGHHLDPAYSNVILHVVGEHDRDCYTCRGVRLCTTRLAFSQHLSRKYVQLFHGNQFISCHREIQGLDPLITGFWLERLAVERLESRAGEIKQVLEQTGGDWSETKFRWLMRGFGQRINSLPFYLLAKSVSCRIMNRYRHNLNSSESLLFGLAGFLEDVARDAYQDELSREFNFLSQKHQLRPIRKSLWKFLRLRPASFPTIRIAQLAMLLCRYPDVIDGMLDIGTLKEARSLLNAATSAYWSGHYCFGRTSRLSEKRMGDVFRLSLLINTVIPLQYVYGMRTGTGRYQDRAVSLLESLPPEDNHVIRNWKRFGIIPENAFYSQALLQLQNKYCIFRKCLHCQIGSLIVR